MMHFSIPDTHEFYNETTGSTYTGYNIYVNGNFHCCVRYKQLHSLHEQLKRSSSGYNNQLPSFPSKKILPLTPNQLEQRRLALERYLQFIGQHQIFSKSELLRTFLLNAQQETAAIEQREIVIDIYLINGFRISVNCYTTEYSTKILEKCMQQNIDFQSKESINYFALYLMQRNDTNDELLITRKLMDFESPYISQRLIDDNGDCKIVIRKCYWDSSYDHHLMNDNVALNLLYIQTVSDVESGWIVTTNEIKDQLRSLEERGNKREYLEIARCLPCYGCIKFSNSIVDYPEPNTNAVILIGNRELIIRTNLGPKIQETKFKVTRMRCWRVTTIHSNDDFSTSTNTSCIEDHHQHQNHHQNFHQTQKFELAFEYLMNKDCLKWITISSKQAMFMSVCLQSMVDELMNLKDGNEYNNSKVQHNNYTQLYYVRRDSAGMGIVKPSKTTIHHQISDSSSSDTLSSLNDTDIPVQHPTESLFSARRKNRNNSRISTTVIFRNERDEPVHNEAFEGIGDDDL